MNSTIQARRARYIEALRSGRYTQAYGAWGAGSHVCVLGVAREELAIRPEYFVEKYEQISSFLGESSAWGRTMMVRNDQQHWTFEQFAENLEERWGIKSGEQVAFEEACSAARQRELARAQLAKPSVPATAPAPLKAPKETPAPTPAKEPVPA